MVAVRMVQVSVHQVVGMVAVRHRLVSTARPMPMRRIVSAAPVVRRAAGGIGCAHFDGMLVDVIVMRMMEMAIVKVIDVALMADRNMAAARLVDMRMVGVNGVIVRGHGLSFLWFDDALGSMSCGLAIGTCAGVQCDA